MLLKVIVLHPQPHCHSFHPISGNWGRHTCLGMRRSQPPGRTSSAAPSACCGTRRGTTTWAPSRSTTQIWCASIRPALFGDACRVLLVLLPSHPAVLHPVAPRRSLPCRIGPVHGGLPRRGGAPDGPEGGGVGPGGRAAPCNLPAPGGRALGWLATLLPCPAGGGGWGTLHTVLQGRNRWGHGGGVMRPAARCT